MAGTSGGVLSPKDLGTYITRLEDPELRFAKCTIKYYALSFTHVPSPIRSRSSPFVVGLSGRLDNCDVIPVRHFGVTPRINCSLRLIRLEGKYMLRRRRLSLLVSDKDVVSVSGALSSMFREVLHPGHPVMVMIPVLVKFRMSTGLFTATAPLRFGFESGKGGCSVSSLVSEPD